MQEMKRDARAQHHSGRLSIVNQFRTVVNFPVTQGRQCVHIFHVEKYIYNVKEKEKRPKANSAEL
jgi:hypothetical protein